MKLSYQQALWAAYTALDSLYDEKNTYKLPLILSEMNPFLFEPRTCADPALWQSWTECCSAVSSSDFLEAAEVMPVLAEFLRANEEEYKCFDDTGGDYSADEVIKALSALTENGQWEVILNNVHKELQE